MSTICESAWEQSKTDISEETVEARLYLEYKNEAMDCGMSEAEAIAYAESMMQ